MGLTKYGRSIVRSLFESNPYHDENGRFTSPDNHTATLNKHLGLWHRTGSPRDVRDPKMRGQIHGFYHDQIKGYMRGRHGDKVTDVQDEKGHRVSAKHSTPDDAKEHADHLKTTFKSLGYSPNDEDGEVLSRTTKAKNGSYTHHVHIGNDDKSSFISHTLTGPGEKLSNNSMHPAFKRAVDASQVKSGETKSDEVRVKIDKSEKKFFSHHEFETTQISNMTDHSGRILDQSRTASRPRHVRILGQDEDGNIKVIDAETGGRWTIGKYDAENLRRPLAHSPKQLDKQIRKSLEDEDDLDIDSLEYSPKHGSFDLEVYRDYSKNQKPIAPRPAITRTMNIVSKLNKSVPGADWSMVEDESSGRISLIARGTVKRLGTEKEDPPNLTK